MHETNPMMGMRGVRLGLVLPGLYGLQVRAMAEATADRLDAGGSPMPEIMVPLVAARAELALVRDEAERVIAAVAEERDVDLEIPIGTMIELPRAALCAGDLAHVAEFFSFGSNDLTQTTWGFSPRRRRGRLLHQLPGRRHLPDLTVRDHRRRRRRCVHPHGGGGSTRSASLDGTRRLRRARWRSRRPSTSSMTGVSTTSRVRRSVFRLHASRLDAPLSVRASDTR